METSNKIVNYDNLNALVNDIYNTSIDETRKFCGFREGTFSCELYFFYMQYEINISIFYDRGFPEHPILVIRFKPNKDDYSYTWGTIYTLDAYFDNVNTNRRPNYENIKYNLSKLKYFLDNNKVIYEFYTKDCNRRFFRIEDNVREFPKGINPRTEQQLRYGEKWNQVERCKNADKY